MYKTRLMTNGSSECAAVAQYGGVAETPGPALRDLAETLRWAAVGVALLPLALALALTLAMAIGGCGGAEPEQTGMGARPGRDQRPRPPGQGMEVSGIMGTIPDYRIQERLEPKLAAFERCFDRRAAQLEVLGGHLELYFRVSLDGRVRWVYPRQSSIGDRETERCVLGIAAATRFPEPQGGGEAEFAWGFEIPPPDGIRPPVDWDETRVSAVVRQSAGRIGSCSGKSRTSYVVTAYVAPGGQVMSAGAASRDQVPPQQLDCVSDAVRQWQMPDPGSYPAKVTFTVK